MRRLAPKIAIALLLPLGACSFSASDDAQGAGVKGTGSATSRSYAIADFSDIDLRGSDDVDVRVGTGFSVRAEGDSEALDHLKIERDGSTLKIGRRNDNGFHWGKGHSAKIFVTLPRLTETNVAGSGNMTIDRVEGASFKAAVAGSGGLYITAIQLDSAELDIAGSGDMKIAGAAKQLEISIAGSGNVDAGGVKAQGAKVSIMGSGGAKAAVTGNAEVTMMGSGDVDLGPAAKCTTTKMGSGSVSCGN